ncbi:MAG: hypothetical protein VCD00_20495 [Candidatus Hydrogenedentota bacterium]
MKPILASLFIVANLFSATGFASDYDTWIQDLAGDNDSRRAIARHMLPREGMRAVPDLIELLRHDDQRVWRTSRNILSDICHTVAVPGFEEERIALTSQLTGLLEAESPKHGVIESLRLLGIVCPAGYDVAPIAGFLDHNDYHGEALSALILIGSPEACDQLSSRIITLIKGINKVPDKQKSFDAFLESMDALRTISLQHDYAFDDNFLYGLSPMRTRDERMEFRSYIPSAVLRAIGPIGDPKFVMIPMMQSNPILFPNQGERPVNTADMMDGYLHFIESLMLNGGNWDHAIGLYADALTFNGSIGVQAPVLAALCRFGDANIIKGVLAMTAENHELEASILMSLDDVRGRESFDVLLEAYPSASRDMQLGLLGLMGRRQDSVFLDVLLANAESDDLDFRAMAYEGLTRSELPDGVDAITSYVESLPSEDRKFDIDKLLAYADALGHQNATGAAGKAYLTLYQTTDNAEFREIAFQGIKDYPSVEAYEIILSELDLEKLSEASTNLLITLNVMIDSVKYPEESIALREALNEVVTETANVQAILDMAHQQGIAEPFIRKMGFLTRWYLVGPFAWKSSDGFTANPVGAPDIDLEASYPVDGHSHSWVHHETGQIINALGLFGAHDDVSMFAYTTFSSETSKEAQIRVGSDDGVRIWLNGQSVHENNIDRGMLLDQDIVPVHLKAGENQLLVQVTQLVGGWGFMLRLTESDGTPIEVAQKAVGSL